VGANMCLLLASEAPPRTLSRRSYPKQLTPLPPRIPEAGIADQDPNIIRKLYVHENNTQTPSALFSIAYNQIRGYFFKRAG